MPRNTFSNPNYLRRIIPQQAAQVAFNKDLADTKEIKLQREIFNKARIAILDAEEQTKKILQLESIIKHLNMSIEILRSEIDSIKDAMITDMLEIERDQQIAERRNYMRCLRKLQGNPPTEKEQQEISLKRIFGEVSQRIGMPLMILEDIYESAEYAVDICAYWQSKIDMCTRP